MPHHPPAFPVNRHHYPSQSFFLPLLSHTYKKKMLNPGRESPISTSDGVGRTIDNWSVMNFGVRARKTAKNYENYRHWDGGGGWQLGGRDQTEMKDDSGVCSPPLWKTSTDTAPDHQNNNYMYLSPSSKTQAIVRGQRELMEMIRNMPESSYELSLKDLVEHPRIDMGHDETVAEENELLFKKVNAKRNESFKRAQMARSGSMNNGGFLLKLVFPISFGSKNKKKVKSSSTNTCSRVSPKPASDGSSRGGDKEWWKRRFSVLGEGESGGMSSIGSSGSSRSSSSGSRHIDGHAKGHSPGCWPRFGIKRSKMPN